MTEADRRQVEMIREYLATYQPPAALVLVKPKRVHELKPEWQWLTRLDYEAIRASSYSKVLELVKSA